MEFIKRDAVKILKNSGFESHQLIFPENSSSKRVTITRVIVQPGAKNPRHKHENSEQIRVALKGRGELLLHNDKTAPFQSGDTVRFADDEIHGLHNNSDSVFEYLAVTAPPINFRSAYKGERKWRENRRIDTLHKSIDASRAIPRREPPLPLTGNNR